MSHERDLGEPVTGFREGQIVVARAPEENPCWRATPVVVQAGEHGLFVPCDTGEHYIDDGHFPDFRDASAAEIAAMEVARA